MCLAAFLFLFLAQNVRRSLVGSAGDATVFPEKKQPTCSGLKPEVPELPEAHQTLRVWVSLVPELCH